jgi:hypothetical protein
VVSRKCKEVAHCIHYAFNRHNSRASGLLALNFVVSSGSFRQLVFCRLGPPGVQEYNTSAAKGHKTLMTDDAVLSFTELLCSLL